MTLLVLAFLAGCVSRDVLDRDGDGHLPIELDGADCDDADAAVHPDAAEICDGIDNDCDGQIDDGDAAPSVFYADLDGDGFGDTDAPVEACAHPDDATTDGTDCDDLDATAYPGATEDWANGATDNDCDGELEPVTIEYGSDAWVGPVDGAQLGRRLGALGDVDGDGDDEFLASAIYDSTLYENGGAIYLMGSDDGVLGGERIIDAFAEGSFLIPGAAAADLSGDGVPDPLVSSGASRGTVYLIDGTDLAAGPVDLQDDPLWSLEGVEEGAYFGAGFGCVGDLDGDGVDEVAASAPWSTVDGMAEAGLIGIWSGAETGTETLDDAPTLLWGGYAGARAGLVLESAGDVDDDGHLDVLITLGSGDLAAVLPGGGALGGVVAEQASYRLTSSESGEVGAARMVGDVNGDGVLDLANIKDHTVQIFVNLGVATVETTASPYGTVTVEGASYVYDVLDLGDLDEDGRDEILVPSKWYEPEQTAVASIFFGAEFTRGTSFELSEASLLAVALNSGYSFGYRAMDVGDLHGDGGRVIALAGPGDVVPEYGMGALAVLAVPR